jgi:hypothetical protein
LPLSLSEMLGELGSEVSAPSRNATTLAKGGPSWNEELSCMDFSRSVVFSLEGKSQERVSVENRLA